MSTRHLLDTGILIEYLRGSQQAADFLESLEGDLLLSPITVAELFARARNKQEGRVLDHFLLAFEVMPIDEAIARQAGLFRRDYRQSHGTSLADAIIAATALETGARLVSLYLRHYPMLEEVLMPYPRRQTARSNVRFYRP